MDHQSALYVFQVDSNQNDAHIILLSTLFLAAAVGSKPQRIDQNNHVCVLSEISLFLLLFFKIMFCPSNPGTKSQSQMFCQPKELHLLLLSSSYFFFFFFHIPPGALLSSSSRVYFLFYSDFLTW